MAWARSVMKRESTRPTRPPAADNNSRRVTPQAESAAVTVSLCCPANAADGGGGGWEVEAADFGGALETAGGLLAGFAEVFAGSKYNTAETAAIALGCWPPPSFRTADKTASELCPLTMGIIARLARRLKIQIQDIQKRY